ITPRDTEPSNQRSNNPFPRWPVTIRSAFHSSAAAMICSAGWPTRMCIAGCMPEVLARAELAELGVVVTTCVLDDCFGLDIFGKLRRANHGHDRELCTETPRHLKSEEHTSELQSPYDLVCRLLLEKKKKIKKQKTNNNKKYTTHS